MHFYKGTVPELSKGNWTSAGNNSLNKEGYKYEIKEVC